MPMLQRQAGAHPVGPRHEATSPELVEFVDFKWLMAGEGHPIDLDRLQAEPAYTRGCLALAGGSTSATLRRAAARLALALGGSRPSPA